MRNYGDEKVREEPHTTPVAGQLLAVLLDATLEPEERRIFFAGAVRFLAVSRVAVQDYVEARYGAEEWQRTASYLNIQPWGAAVAAAGGPAILTGGQDETEEAES